MKRLCAVRAVARLGRSATAAQAVSSGKQAVASAFVVPHNGVGAAERLDPCILLGQPVQVHQHVDPCNHDEECACGIWVLIVLVGAHDQGTSVIRRSPSGHRAPATWVVHRSPEHGGYGVGQLGWYGGEVVCRVCQEAFRSRDCVVMARAVSLWSTGIVLAGALGCPPIVI